MDKLYSSWNFRKSHLITSSDTSTNYQVKIRVYYTSGTDSGQSVYLNGHCNTDFSDIRFTDNSSNALSYWIETLVDSTYADIWIKLTTLAASNTIYIYYGNGSVSSESSGDDTFAFFDDFEGTSLNTTKWTSTFSNGSRTFSDSILTFSVTGTSLWNSITANTDVNSVDIITGYKYRITSCSAEDCGFRPGIKCSSSTIGAKLASKYLISDSLVVKTLNEGITWGDTLSYTDLNTWYIHEIRDDYSGTTSNFYARVNREDPWTSSEFTAATSWGEHLQIGVFAHNSGTITTNVDWVYQRKYVATEPVHSTWSSEEFLHGIYVDFSYVTSNNFVTFTNKSVTNTNSIINQLNWNFGDSTIDDSSIVTHEYFAPATYNVTLNVSNSQGFASHITKNVTISNQSIFWPRWASIYYEQWPTMEPCEVKLQCISQPSKYTPNTSHLWDFGDSSTSTLQDPFHVYNSSGIKTVTLTVSNIYGSISKTQTIDVSANVKVYFSPSYHEGSPSFNITFHDTSVPQSEILSRTWDFNDGYTSTSASPTHTYSIVGGYSPSLTVTYHGGSKTLTHPNSIIVGLQTRHLSDTFAFKESEETLSVISIIETIDFATVIVPVCEILVDTLSYIQREVPAIHGIIETGHRFAHKISEIGRKIYSKFDEFGRKIIKNPTYTDKTGFSTCDTVIELTDIIQFEESATEFATS